MHGVPYKGCLSPYYWLNFNSNELHSAYSPYIHLIFSNVCFSTVPWPEKEAQWLTKPTFQSSLQNTRLYIAGMQHRFVHNREALPLWNQKLNKLIDICVFFSFALKNFFALKQMSWPDWKTKYKTYQRAQKDTQLPLAQIISQSV